jgi:hypothetical protein
LEEDWREMIISADATDCKEIKSKLKSLSSSTKERILMGVPAWLS